MSSEPVAQDGPPSVETSLLARVAPKLLISLALGALFAWLVERGGVPLLPQWSTLQAVRWELVLAATVLLFLLTVVRATRWRFLIAPVKKLPLREVILVNWVGFFAIFALPLRLGELARPTLSKLRAQVPVSAGLGTVAVERVLDGALTSLCVTWALWALPRRADVPPAASLVPAYASLVVGVFIAAMLALAAFLWQHDRAVRITERVAGLVSPRLGHFLSEKVDSVADGVRSIAQARLALGFLFETLVYWSTNACFMWVLGLACGLPMELGHAVAVMGVLALGILLPGGPGLFGSFQISVSVALQLYFPDELVQGPGAAFIFLLYLLNAAMMCAVGVPALLRMHIPLKALVAPKLDDSLRPPRA